MTSIKVENVRCIWSFIAGLSVSLAVLADECPHGVYHASEVPGSPRLLASGMAWRDGNLVIADRKERRLVVMRAGGKFETLHKMTQPFGVAFDPNGEVLAVDTIDVPEIVRLGAHGNAEVLVAGKDAGTPHFLAVHPNGTIYWSGFPDGGTRSRTPDGTVTVHRPRIGHTFGIALSPRQDWLYVTSKLPDKDRRTVWRFPVASDGTLGEGKPFFFVKDLKPRLEGLPAPKDGDETLLGWIGRLQGLAIDRGGNFYLGGAEAHTSGVAVAVISPDGKKVCAMILDVPRNIASLTLSGDERTLYIGGAGEYRLHQVCFDTPATIPAPTTVHAHERWISSISFSPDGQRIVSGSADETLKVWDSVSGKELLTIPTKNAAVTCVAYSPDGKRIASGGWDGALVFWDAQSGKNLLSVHAHTQSVTSLAFSPDGTRIASGSGDNTLKVWDAQTGKTLITLRQGGEYNVTCVAFSPDGKRVVSGDGENLLHISDAHTGEDLLTLRGHEGAISSVAFTPDGNRIVSGSWDHTLKIWDATTGTELRTLLGHADDVTCAACSPDGKLVVSGSEDQTAKAWDTESGKEVLTLRGHDAAITSVRFSPDGKRIASSSRGVLKIWALP